MWWVVTSVCFLGDLHGTGVGGLVGGELCYPRKAQMAQLRHQTWQKGWEGGSLQGPQKDWTTRQESFFLSPPTPFFFVLAGFRGFVEVARGAGFGRGNTWSRMLWPCLGDAVTVIQAHTAHHEAGVKRKLPSRRSVASLSETPCCPVLPLGPPFSPFLNSPGKSPAFPATASAVHHA